MGRATEFFDYLNTDMTKPEFYGRYSSISWHRSRQDKLWIIATWEQTRMICTECENIVLKATPATICKKCNLVGEWVKEKDYIGF
jgi:hypothetical protein